MRTTRILHLTDLHYGGSDSYSDEVKSHVPDAYRNDRLEILSGLLRGAFNGEKFDLIAVSGDITTRGRPEGLKLFLNKAGPILQKLATVPAALCLVPGNHDVTWGLPSTERDYYGRKFAAYRDLVQALRCTSSLIPRGTVPRTSRGTLSFVSGVTGPLYIDESAKLLAVCINSAMRCGELDQKFEEEIGGPARDALEKLARVLRAQRRNNRVLHEAEELLKTIPAKVHARAVHDISHVTTAQLRALQSRLDTAQARLKDEWLQYVKVAILHHHLIPFSGQQPEHKAFELTADAANVLDMLASYDVQIVLTGHKHQPYCTPTQFYGKDMLVLGGMTVGGLPVLGSSAGVRYVEVSQEEKETRVRVIDLPCEQVTNPRAEVEAAIKAARGPYILRRGPADNWQRRALPAPIEQALEKQLYSRSFYKSKVVFTIVVRNDGSGMLKFVTTLSYDVTNMSLTPHEWTAEYNYDRRRGKVVKALVGRPIHLNPEHFTDRGLRIATRVQPNETKRIELKIEELFGTTGTNFFTSYNPATDLRVELANKASDVEFNFEALADLDTYSITRNKNTVTARLDDGLLPNQGFRLYWKLKETET